MVRCCRILGVTLLQRGHFQEPASNSVGKVLPWLKKAGHLIPFSPGWESSEQSPVADSGQESLFLNLAGGARGES